MHDLFAMMAGYNRWANGRLLAAAAALSGDRLRADAGAFFGSMLGTLNHLLVADRIWMHRFTGKGEPPARLDAVLFEDLAALAEARRAEDERIIAHVAGLSEAALAGPLSYRTISRPAPVTQPRWAALAHFFNHQTHHRGQAHAILTRHGEAPPSFDLVVFQRETGTGPTASSP